MEYILLFAGFILLLYSGKYLVKGSVLLAQRFNISKLVIGVTVVSFGTSAPELFVSLIAAVNNHPEVTIGNVIGSNIANIALVLAFTAIIIPIPVKGNSIKIDAPMMLLASILLYVFILNGILGFFEGLLFVLMLVGYNFFSIRYSIKTNIANQDVVTEKQKHWIIIAVMILVSTIGLSYGSKLLVDNATIIAKEFGISERIIAITLVAFGTSLPELATSVIAAFKKEMDISIGNIIGSNIFNIFGVLGITSMIKAVPIASKFISIDIFWMLGIAILLFLFILPFKGGRLTRVKGAVLFVAYCAYIYSLFIF
ncbi:MAG: calcium/sodium antiporter [Bacteroidales bacterium]|nr:calcium/sodium antiporter [Bacteroidales bacterium]